MKQHMISRKLFGSTFILTLFMFMPQLEATEGALSPVGLWRTIDDSTNEPKSVVQIVERNGKLYGTIKSLMLKPGQDPNPLCKECQGTNHNKPMIGLQILWDLQKDGNEWAGGRILDPDNGKDYKCFIEVTEGGKRLKVRGYLGFALLGRTQHWERVTQ